MYFTVDRARFVHRLYKRDTSFKAGATPAYKMRRYVCTF